MRSPRSLERSRDTADFLLLIWEIGTMSAL